MSPDTTNFARAAIPSACMKYIHLIDGLTYNTRGYFTSCVVFFPSPVKMRAMSVLVTLYGEMT